LLYLAHDSEGKLSRSLRALFLRETIKSRAISPPLMVSYSGTDRNIDRTFDLICEALYIYRMALDEGREKYLVGRLLKLPFVNITNVCSIRSQTNINGGKPWMQ